MSLNAPKYTFKILLLGDGGVGKTSLVNRFVNATFSQMYLQTIGMQPSQKYLKVKNTDICLSIFDIAGEKSFKGLREMFYRGSKGALVTFDLTRRESFQNVEVWLKEAKHKEKKQQFILIGNKNDLDGRQVSSEEAEEMAKSLGCLKYFETSALTGELVDDAFKSLGSILLSETKS
ncbi:MAG: GTP-binding protein [Candidatus Heimdallarchaeota archaeon]|nr:GTP-binding protein [Candidatus Heimdallarchaeota archaeon]